MRLDHLLSKEHWPATVWDLFLVWLVQSRARTVKLAQSRVGSGVRDGAQGWNADQFGQVSVSAASTALVSFGVLVCGTWWVWGSWS